MNPNTILPFCSSLLSFVFAALVLDQWMQRRRSFQIVWFVGLIFYGVSAGTEFLGSAAGWNSALYRIWYLVGALLVAAYLGAGTVYLLRRTRFGYFVAFTVALGGLLALAFSAKYPGSRATADVVFETAIIAAIAVVYATALHRPRSADVTMAFLVLGSIAVAVLVLTAPVSAPGYALDPRTHVPVGNAMPGYVRVLTGPFNIMGALCLVFGGVFSAYVYMPKRKLMRAHIDVPVMAQVYGATAVLVNFVVSLPLLVRALLQRRLNSRVPATLLIAAGAFVPGVTSGLNRYEITWAFFLGEFLGLLLIFLGFLVSEEMFRDIRVVFTNLVIWKRGDAPHLELG